MGPEFGTSTPGEYANSLLAQARKTMFGMDDEIRLVLAAFFCGRHVLLEGNPGLGKTTLVKALSSVLNLPYRRIQFTPDLMPSDITGTLMPDMEDGAGRSWCFQPGPIFANLLLADEINRATPKTQSAMLEAMEEQQVTVLNHTYYLPDNTGKKNDNAPFMVLATQNPIDHEGVYNLPEAQADRFMFKLIVQMPGQKHLLDIMEQEAGRKADPSGSAAPLPRENQGIQAGADLTEEQKQQRTRSLNIYKEIKRQIREVQNPEPVSMHIANLVMASNGKYDQMYDPVKNKENQRRLETLVKLLQFGLGPRAAINLLLGAKAVKLLFPNEGTAAVEKSTPQANVPGPAQLVKVLVPTLRHRLHLGYDWEEAQFFRSLPDTNARMLAYISHLAYLTAPDDALYRRRLKEELGKIEPSVGTLA